MRANCSRKAGFTLVELLVVMTLISLVMLALFSGMRSMGQIETRIDTRLALADEFRTTVSFLHASLDRVSSRKLNGQQADASPLPFVAAENEMTWIGVMPARYGSGGRHFFRLSVENTNSGTAAWVIRYIPWSADVGALDWNSAQSLVLVDKVASLNILYQDLQDQVAKWRSDWPIADRLPRAVSFSLRTQSTSWPVIVIAMRPMPGMEDLIGSITAGHD